MGREQQPQDILVRGIALGGELRVIAAVTSRLADHLRVVHDAGPIGAVALSRAATAALLLSATIKDRQQVGIQINGDGPIGEVYAIAGAEAQLRATIANPRAEAPVDRGEKSALAAGLGLGRFTVIRSLDDQPAHRGIVELVSGEVGEDLAHYLTHSEQVPSAVLLGERLDSSGIRVAAGLLIQALPGASEDELDKIEERLSAMAPLTQLLDMKMSVEGILDRIFDDFETLHSRTPAWNCPCSREHFARKLVTLGESTLRELVEGQENTQVQCHFCRTEYEFDAEQMSALLYGARLYGPKDEAPESDSDS